VARLSLRDRLGEPHEERLIFGRASSLATWPPWGRWAAAFLTWR